MVSCDHCNNLYGYIAPIGRHIAYQINCYVFNCNIGHFSTVISPLTYVVLMLIITLYHYLFIVLFLAFKFKNKASGLLNNNLCKITMIIVL